MRREGRNFELVGFEVLLLQQGLDGRALVGRRIFSWLSIRAWNSCSMSGLRRDLLLASPSLPFDLGSLVSFQFGICAHLPPSSLFFFKRAVPTLVSRRGGLGACVTDDFVRCVRAWYVVFVRATQYFCFWRKYSQQKKNRRVLLSRRRRCFFRIIIFLNCPSPSAGK